MILDASGCIVLPVELDRSVSPAELLAALPGPAVGRMLCESGLAAESLAGGPGAPAPGAARWSWAAAEPVAVLSGAGQRFALRQGGRVIARTRDPFELLDRVLGIRWGEERRLPDADLPPFAGGAAGYLAYDLARHVERLPARARPVLRVPDLWLALYDTVCALDHLSGRVWLLGTPLGPIAPSLAGRASAREALASLRAKMERWYRALQRRARRRGAAPPLPGVGRLHSDFSRRGYTRAVADAVRRIHAGEVFQVNLSQRFWVPLQVGSASRPGWRLYLRLREVAPAPFAAYISGPAFEVVSGSPECFLRVEPAADGWRVETRPIKGTRPRGRTDAEDRVLVRELLASEKDQAELTMIVDLCRNDLGRVARLGSVRVAELRRLETFTAVHHTVSTIEARLRPGTTAGQLLRAAFPAGSVTGAPKVQAMKVIEQLEPVRRHVYCGSIGVLGSDGRLCLNVAIRTAVVAAGVVSFHAGGGIVADSDPEEEYEETLAKAAGMLAALDLPLPGGSRLCTPG